MADKGLNYIKLGQGHPIIILHGLYGSGSNWMTIGKDLAGFAEVYLVDQRNHGDSPHFNNHSYPAMMQDLIEFLDEHGLKKVVLLGHSMGGKTAIWTAINHPERVSHLVVADISPLAYTGSDNSRHQLSGHERIMGSMLNLDLSKVDSLRDADELLQGDFPDKQLRQFLMKNLEKSKDGHYNWRLNIPVLLNSLDALSEGIDEEMIQDQGYRQFPVLFLKGGNSNYITVIDERGIRKIFPLAQIVTLKNAGHWLHAEQPKIFVDSVKKFLFNY